METKTEVGNEHRHKNKNNIPITAAAASAITTTSGMTTPIIDYHTTTPNVILNLSCGD